MVIRRIQLKNNLYLDGGSSNSEPLGEYCVFGYFDAMSIGRKENGESGAWKVLSEGVIREIDGRCSVRSLLCVSGDEEKDKIFWKTDIQKVSYPLLFVSIIRLKEPIEITAIREKMDELNQLETGMAYFSYEHSELIAFFKTNKYSEGHKFCKKLHNMFQIYKMYTIFSVKEETLESYNKVKKEIIEEKVDCRLRAVVKDWSKLHEMKEKLRDALEEETGFRPSVSERHMMGNADVLFEMNSVSIQKLLTCYKTNELLTHSNPYYQKVFYNIETEIPWMEEENGDRVD